MAASVYEFPLKEKIRNYLRIEHVLAQLRLLTTKHEPAITLYFFEQLFTLLDLFDRIDLRTDTIKELDTHERNLVYWSQFPNIDASALEKTLQKTLVLREQLKQSKKFGADLKEDRFLSSIRQRFAIPGGTCSFDLPNLHYWLSQPFEAQKADMEKWLSSIQLLEEVVALSLAFIRERGQFQPMTAVNGFYQGNADDKNELVRIRCGNEDGFYPTLSGNKFRYAIRFMWISPSAEQSSSVERNVEFTLATC